MAMEIDANTCNTINYFERNMFAIRMYLYRVATKLIRSVYKRIEKETTCVFIFISTRMYNPMIHDNESFRCIANVDFQRLVFRVSS